MWPKTILPSRVAGPLAAKAVQCIGLGGDCASGESCRKRLPSRPSAVASSAGSSVSISGQELRATMSIKSRGRPSNRALPRAGAVGDALHFFEIFLLDSGAGTGHWPGSGRASSRRRAISGSAQRRSSGHGRRFPGPSIGHVASRVDTARPRCAARSSRPADIGNRYPSVAT